MIMTGSLTSIGTMFEVSPSSSDLTPSQQYPSDNDIHTKKT
jgi:hypothetical protein